MLTAWRTRAAWVAILRWLASPLAGSYSGRGGKEIGLLSPVAGEVVATNGSAGENGSEPYGAGWLFQVKPSQWTRSRAQLIDGQAAREWMEEQARQLYGRLSPEAVPMLQDGGVPIHGIAREIEPARWDEVAREFFRTQES